MCCCNRYLDIQNPGNRDIHLFLSCLTTLPHQAVSRLYLQLQLITAMHPAIRKGGVAVITGGGTVHSRLVSTLRRADIVRAGAGGIGAALGATFASHGMRLALIDNNKASLDEAVKAFKLPESDVLAVEADVSDFSSMQNAASKVQQQFGQNVNVLCLNAGTSSSGAHSWSAPEIWTKVRSGDFRMYTGDRHTHAV